jgi:hypothetical protein
MTSGQNNQDPPGTDFPGGAPLGIEPPVEGAPGAAAAELVAHGLLEYLRLDGPDARRVRIARAVEAIAAESEAPARRLVFVRPSRRVVRWAVAAAALLAMGLAAYFIGIPGEQTALAEIQGAVKALRSPGARRYEVRLEAAGDRDGGGRLGAVVDMCCTDSGSVGKRLVQHWPPWKMEGLFVGRDEKGEWAVRPEGGVERERPHQYWPPWSVDGESLTVDSLDTLLEQLPRRYTLVRDKNATLDGGAGILYERVTASRTDRAGPYPHRVELWFDHATHVAERVEFQWDLVQSGTGQGPPAGGGGGPPSDGADHRPPPPPDHGGRGGGLKRITFQLVDAPTFPADWFTPQGHGAK